MINDIPQDILGQVATVTTFDGELAVTLVAEKDEDGYDCVAIKVGKKTMTDVYWLDQVASGVEQALKAFSPEACQASPTMSRMMRDARKAAAADAAERANRI